MVVSKSCCCSCFTYTFFAILTVLIAIIAKHKTNERISPSRNRDEDLLEHKLVEAVQEIKYDLIRRFPDKKPKAMPLVDGNPIGIKSVEWLNRSSFDDAVDKKRPFVLYDSPASHWEALSWDLWNISTRWPLLNNVLVTEDESFIVLQQEGDVEGDGTAGLIGQSNLQPSNPDVIYEMLFTNFLFHAASPKMFMVYSTNYRIMESIAKLSKQTPWRRFRISEPMLANAKLPKDTKLKQPSAGITFAHPGVSMQAKYSALHTCRVQLLGTGRYILFPPAKQSSLYLYPAIHASHHQSQVLMHDELENDVHPADSNFPLFKSQAASSARAVTLNPGDVLYIPPYWLVRSEFPVLSVFLDVPSLSAELLHFKEAEFTSVPLGKMTENPDERIIGAQVYLMHFLSRVEGLKSPKKFAENHYKSRYSVLYPKNGLFMRKNSKYQCFSDQAEYQESIVKKLDREAIESSAQHAADCVNEPSISSGIRWMFVGDYVDKIARWAMQDPDKAVLFLTSCLNFDSKLNVVQEEEGPSVMKIGANAVDKDGKRTLQE